MASFSKFFRPTTPRPGITSERDLDIIEAILRYRFSPTSELTRLVGGHEDATRRRLRLLWERQIVNRFAFPNVPNHGEFIYYLDRTEALDLLLQGQRLDAIHPEMEEEIRLNREADYASAVVKSEHMKLGFLKHSLMISRIHFLLEMAGRTSSARTALSRWLQGAQLRGQKVEVPTIYSRRVEGSNAYVWEEHDHKTERLPVEPDALFTLCVSGQRLHFCYEADRGSMPLADMLRKLRAYYHFIKRQQKHKEAWSVHPIRSVLIETTSEARARKLMDLVEQPGVIGTGKRSGLFWFTISPMFTAPSPAGRVSLPSYLARPEIILQRLWALSDGSLHAVTDVENFTATSTWQQSGL